MKTLAKKTKICVSLMVISFLFASMSYAGIDPGTIAGLWLFDEGDGDTVEDSSGNGNDGTLINDVEWVKGKFGEALQFDGADVYVQIPDADSLDMEDEITVVFWFKTTKNMVAFADRQAVVGKHYLEYEVCLYANGVVHTYTSDGAGNYDEGIMESIAEELPEGTWELDEWYHLAWILDGKHETVYINGINIGEFDKAHEGTQPGSHPLEIGRRVGGTLQFEGAVDEVMILNVVLTEDDVQACMEQGIEGALGLSPVSPGDKLATSWATIKVQ